ncbi:MAG: peptide deformylase [Patescibacteria group bacterium]|nr:peptide deformylase [Patescibacteria group bacterium]
MSILKIQTGAKNEFLRKKSEPVKVISKEIVKLAADMKDIVANEKGLGLAAPQVGQNIRVIVVQIEKMHIPMINPEITQKSKKTEVCEEGCLSLPGKYLNISRACDITVKFLDHKGNEQILKLSKINARVVQHEIDHLNGVLIVDY